jgi:hypothetical protein
VGGGEQRLRLACLAWLAWLAGWLAGWWASELASWLAGWLLHDSVQSLPSQTCSPPFVITLLQHYCPSGSPPCRHPPTPPTGLPLWGLIHEMQSCDPALTEDDIKLVLSADGTSLGEAFVHLHGPRAKVRLALAKDRSILPVSAMAGGGGSSAVGRAGWAGRHARLVFMHGSCRATDRPPACCCDFLLLQSAQWPMEVMTAVEADLQRRMLSGCRLV